jgi:hypothetical protein
LIICNLPFLTSLNFVPRHSIVLPKNPQHQIINLTISATGISQKNFLVTASLRSFTPITQAIINRISKVMEKTKQEKIEPLLVINNSKLETVPKVNIKPI